MGNRAFHFCLNGYQLSGPIERVCLRTSEWSLPEPYCISKWFLKCNFKIELVNFNFLGVRCSSVTNLANGFVIMNTTENGNMMVTYSCKDGFILNGQKNSFCLDNGTWSSVAPNCMS